MLDSSAEFEARAAEIGLAQGELNRLKTLGYNTFGRLAFASNFVPGQPDEAPLIRLASQITQQSPPPDDRVALVRRLVFESYTLAAADLKARTERKHEDAPRKLTQAERASRQQDQMTRLRHLDLSGELEPSHALVDYIFQMQEENQLRYVRWEVCTKRDQELMGLKTDATWKPDASGIVREVQVKESITADTSSDLKLEKALQRRSIAFDQARLVEFTKFEEWTQVLLEAYTAEPPPGFYRVSLEQLHRADLEFFKGLMKDTRAGIRPTGGLQPIQAAVDNHKNSPSVMKHLQPLPKPAGSRSNDKEDKDTNSKSSSDTAQVNRLKRQLENLQGQIRNMKSKGGKNSGKGKTKTSFIKMPAGLIGQNPVTEDGESKCFDFNLKGCKLAAPGGRCVKGLHLCTRIGCDKPHSQKDHDK